jgi:hypothetical protein
MRKIFTTLSLVVVFAIVATTSGAAAIAVPTAGVLLADYSLDTTAAQRAQAVQIVGVMADLAAPERGLIAAAPFQSSALATIDWPILHRFIPKPSDPNSYYVRVDLRQQAGQVKRKAKALFGRQSHVQGTDLLGGLLAAAELFSSQAAGRRTLVLDSNMWLYDPPDHLALKQRPLSQGEIAPTIAKLARAGKVADLRGVCVYVVGGGLDPRRQIPNATQISLREFWQAYLRRAGATLRAWTPKLDTEPTC